MAGETIKSEAICLEMHPWSRTSHVVEWLTPDGTVTTVVKGAVRPKSAFLGQYDLNYTCEIVRYARLKNGVCALRECAPLERRDGLRGDYRGLALAGWFRRLAAELAPSGPDCRAWYAALSSALSSISPADTLSQRLAKLLGFELKVLDLLGLTPDLVREEGAFLLRGERRIPVSSEVAACLRNPRVEKKSKILLDAARVIGVFYTFHLDCASDVRRVVLRMISENE